MGVRTNEINHQKEGYLRNNLELLPFCLVSLTYWEITDV